jgi:hypothetical protein
VILLDTARKLPATEKYLGNDGGWTSDVGIWGDFMQSFTRIVCLDEQRDKRRLRLCGARIDPHDILTTVSRLSANLRSRSHMGQQGPEDNVGDTGLDAGRYRTLAMAGVSTPVKQCRYLILDFINRFFGP